jgi:S-DNA-T family DNA segregation ATPase FtsK/SpoIIIE
MSGGSKMTRVHAPFCSDTEVENIVNFIKSQNVDQAASNMVTFDEDKIDSSSTSQSSAHGEEGKDGDLYTQAVLIVRRDKKTSISYIQRQLRIGYNRAANLIEKMEDEGVLGAPNSSGKREIIDEN